MPLTVVIDTQLLSWGTVVGGGGVAIAKTHHVSLAVALVVCRFFDTNNRKVVILGDC